MNMRAVLGTGLLYALSGGCAAPPPACEAPAPASADAVPIALDAMDLFGLWDLHLVHQEPGRKGQVDRYVARLWAPDSMVRELLWTLRRNRPGLLAIGTAAVGTGPPDSAFRWQRDSTSEPIVVLDSAFVLGDLPGGVDGSRDLLTVREAAADRLRGRWTSAYFGVPVIVDGRTPPPDPDGYFCATRRKRESP